MPQCKGCGDAVLMVIRETGFCYGCSTYGDSNKDREISRLKTQVAALQATIELLTKVPCQSSLTRDDDCQGNGLGSDIRQPQPISRDHENTFLEADLKVTPRFAGGQIESFDLCGPSCEHEE